MIVQIKELLKHAKTHRYSVEFEKFRLRNLATCSSAQQRTGIKATVTNTHIN